MIPAEFATKKLDKLERPFTGERTPEAIADWERRCENTYALMMFAEAYYSTAKQFLPVPEIADPILKKYAYEVGYALANGGRFGSTVTDVVARMEKERAARDDAPSALPSRPAANAKAGALATSEAV